ncbi:MAG: polysaccharide biosynthesis tyrosine autokinase [Isosphaeraceae bacterium]|nr:polysaccharide biosynthesis tyrosine autokinase [Isosphaeraceae bacterium]
MPARASHVPPAKSVSHGDYDDEYAYAEQGPPRKKFSAHMAWRAFRRYWWQALCLWVVGSAGLVTLAYYRVKPVYEAVAQFRVEPTEDIFNTKNFNQATFAEYRTSQVTLVTSPNVLSDALYKHPELFHYPLLQDAENAQDAEGVIRRSLQVAPVRETNQIQVSMTSTSSEEAAGFVNAVVKAYIDDAKNIRDRDAKLRRQSLERVELEAKTEVDHKRDALQQLRDKLGNETLLEAKDRNQISAEAYGHLNQELVKVRIERIGVQGQLETLRGEKPNAARAADPRELDEAIKAAFYADPFVHQVVEKRAAYQNKMSQVQKTARNPSGDSAYRHFQTLVAEQDASLDRLWKTMEPRLRRQFASGTGDADVDRIISATERQLASLVAQEQALNDQLEAMTLKNDRAGNDALKVGFAQSDLLRAEAVLSQVQTHLRQLDFESRNALARIQLDFEARPMLRPSSNHRLHAMLAAPVVVWFAVLGLLSLVELKSGRVADPDELLSRSRLHVLGVVPPLPRIRPSGGGQLALGHDDRAQRQLDEFVQSLDHLRVALCARPDPWGRNRHCVLITSACGSEGKTTLAAQLAERCVNAGLSTLLIDADLRNPTLSRMLDAEQEQGLINVLRGERSPEDAIIVVEDAGGFHFLPAGTPRVDPSRLLQGDRLGNLLAQARESFDMIIVDAPPVLPVPDALTIGRWTDGAVLAVRYDASRFPLVDRANRRLAQVGVPVLGAVVNGMRSPDGAYGGSYAYGGHSSAEPAV